MGGYEFFGVCGILSGAVNEFGMGVGAFGHSSPLPLAINS